MAARCTPTGNARSTVSDAVSVALNRAVSVTLSLSPPLKFRNTHFTLRTNPACYPRGDYPSSFTNAPDPLNLRFVHCALIAIRLPSQPVPNSRLPSEPPNVFFMERPSRAAVGLFARSDFHDDARHCETQNLWRLRVLGVSLRRHSFGASATDGG